MKNATPYRYLIACLLLVLSCGLVSPPAAAQVFLPDDPVWVDPDRMDMPAPEPWEVSDTEEFFQYTFKTLDVDYGPAVNVNTLGEVPNSSWYVNRHYWNPMSIEELKRGANTVEGPSKEEKWQVVAAKREGKSLGMQIVDARGDRYLFKFDPMEFPESSSAAEVIVTKLFYALGYHVPENYVVYFEKDDLALGEKAAEEGIDQEFINSILEQVPVDGQGRYRAMASKFVEGKPLGPFRYHGTRKSDANDIFPHEMRRELRGMRLFAAWVEHIDIRSSNSLSTLVEEDGRQYVRHYLLDFGTTLGGGPVTKKRRWFGHEYILEPLNILKRAVSLGFWGSDWVDIDYPALPSVGRFEAEHFEPEEWRPQYPNPAYSNSEAEDEFWAAKQVMNFTEEEIRAIVATGRYSNPEAAEYVTQTLVARRNRIGRAYLDFGGGLDRFEVENGRLTFVDLQAKYGWTDADRTRSVIWRPFDNATGETGEVIVAGERSGTRLEVPEVEVPFLAAEIRTPGQGLTHVYLRRSGDSYEVVGLDREE